MLAREVVQVPWVDRCHPPAVLSYEVSAVSGQAKAHVGNARCNSCHGEDSQQVNDPHGPNSLNDIPQTCQNQSASSILACKYRMTIELTSQCAPVQGLSFNISE